MTRAIHKTLIILVIIIFRICDLMGQSAIERDTSKFHPLEPKSINSVKATNVSTDTLIQIQEPLQGCLCDPVFRNELGISIIGSIKTPNIGLGINYNPLFLNRLNVDLIYRSDFNHDFVIHSGLETKNLSKWLPFDFRFEYNSYNLSNSILTDYHKYLAGMIYRIPWSSMGLLIGQDNYRAKKNFGYEMFVKYKFHVAINKCCEPYEPISDIYAGISYWKGSLNYKIKLDYLLNNSLSIGMGYEKIYNFNELFFTLRYMVFYF